ncbi:MAG: GNAT family N-acetyltransferase [Saprospiraceae bacterium]|nr:GNAT family N-acetyltransferase [Saprospiraceae bacterium]
MITRKATFEDLGKLARLFDEYRVFYEKETDVLAAGEFLRDRLVNKESEIFVAEAQDKALTGFVQLYPIFSSTRMKRLWLLNDLYVHPDYRGRGISVLLIDKAKELAVHTQSAGLILETAKSNFIGNKLYPKTDFVLDEEHNYYSWNT